MKTDIDTLFASVEELLVRNSSNHISFLKVHPLKTHSYIKVKSHKVPVEVFCNPLLATMLEAVLSECGQFAVFKSASYVVIVQTAHQKIDVDSKGRNINQNSTEAKAHANTTQQICKYYLNDDKIWPPPMLVDLKTKCSGQSYAAKFCNYNTSHFSPMEFSKEVPMHSDETGGGKHIVRG